MYSRWGAFVDDVDKFDPLFFNIAPVEAELMDPQERLFLQIAWHALEDAGYTRSDLARWVRKEYATNVGVFVGVTTNTYSFVARDNSGARAMPTTLPWSLANRVSYLFNFSGPSIPVDTACSSSLTAIHLACEAIRNGTCQQAIAGGVNLYLHPSKYVSLCLTRMLSTEGKCRAFGEGGDGFVPGEGVGAVLLKPLSLALADGDHVYGLIKATAVNHGGRTNGYTVPNPAAQAELISHALKQSAIDPGTLTYFEAHGTGTALGDPIEVDGLAKAFSAHEGGSPAHRGLFVGIGEDKYRSPGSCSRHCRSDQSLVANEAPAVGAVAARGSKSTRISHLKARPSGCSEGWKNGDRPRAARLRAERGSAHLVRAELTPSWWSKNLLRDQIRQEERRH